MKTSTQRLQPPSRSLRFRETRAIFEIGAGYAAFPWLSAMPPGDGHPVLVYPGLTASDDSTRLLRDLLSQRGYRVSGWGLGHNYGPRPGIEPAMLDSLDRMNDDTGSKVSLIGWSLGGLYARALAAKRTAAVRSVITLGSPITDSRATGLSRLYEFTSHRRADDADDTRAYRPTPRVPTTSIYSRTDGIVNWQCSVEKEGPESENIEVQGSHIGLACNPAVLYAIGDRLAQPEGQWQRFERTGLRRLFFPDPARAEVEHLGVPPTWHA